MRSPTRRRPTAFGLMAFAGLWATPLTAAATPATGAASTPRLTQVAPAATQVAPASAGPTALAPMAPQALADRAAFDGYFGLYVGGQKVGWLHEVLTARPHIEVRYELEATIGGMGQQSHVSMRERRRYQARAQGRLESISFAQTAQTGAVRVEGARRGARFDVQVEAGGARRRHQLDVPETLADALASWRLGGLGRNSNDLKVGDNISAAHFDASSQAVTGAQIRIERIEEQLVGGLPSRLVHLATRYPTLSVNETSVLDARGQLLRMQIGSFFEARREEEKVAKTPVVPGDLLLDAVVAVPHPIAGVQNSNALMLTLSGLDDVTLPESARQHVQRLGNTWDVTLRRDAPLAESVTLAGVQRTTPLNRKRKDPAARREEPDVQAARQATPFIQSDAKEIRDMAQHATAQTASVNGAIAALVAAVRGHLTSEYVPAFSNALEAYHSRRGDCTEHSVLFVALARAIGLPARVAVGTAYWAPAKGFGWHAWAEVWTGERWLSVDPTWDQPVADVTHLKVAGGDPSSQVRMVMLLGRLKIEQWRAQP